MEVELMNNPYDQQTNEKSYGGWPKHHLGLRGSRGGRACLDSIDTNANGQNLKSMQKKFEERKIFNNGQSVLNSINS